MNKTLLIIVTAFFLIPLKAQQVSGYVIDATSGEVLIGAYIYTKNGNGAVTSNSFGFFTIKTEESDSLIISFVGFNKKTIVYKSNKKYPLQIRLKPSTKIEEVTVTAGKYIQKIPEMGLIKIPIQQIKTMPFLAGESDIMKSLQLMPGIKSTGEGQSSFMVRGGSPDQNMIILDNVPLYYINHLDGFVSVFNTEALNSVKMYKGAFPARYGGRLSSIIQVNTKDGNLKKNHTSLTLGLISTKLLTEGPIKKDTLSYIISVRRFMYDLISRPLTYLSDNKKQWGYTFYDVNAKLNYKPNQNNRLYLSFYTGQDKILSKRKEKKDEISLMKNTSKWGNFSTSLRWNHIYGRKLFSNISAYYMQYKYSSEFEYSFEENSEKHVTKSDFNSNINDLGINSDFEYYIYPKLNFRFGSNHIYHIYKPNNYNYSSQYYLPDSINNSSKINEQKVYAFENTIYIETEFTPSNYLAFNIGYRLSIFNTKGENHISNEPRAVISLNLPNIFSIKGSYAKMSQNVHLLSYAGGGIPADIWMPATDNVPPQQSEIISLGIFHSIKNKNIDISIETYYKKLSNLVDYKTGYNIFSSKGDWTNAIEQDGIGESKGVEFLLQRKTGKLSGWIAYTLSKSTRQFKNINNGKPYLHTYDATHDFSIVSNYKIKNNITFSATWSYTSGRAITIPNERYDTPVFRNGLDFKEPPKIKIYSGGSYEQKNNVRMNPYHRLDVAITIKKHKKRSDRILSLGIYNLYNRQNAIYYYVGAKSSSDEMGRPIGNTVMTVYQVSMFPIIPSISYTWQW